MLFPPVTVQDLSILIAVSAILLLITAELLPYIFGEKTFVSDMKKLRNLALVLGALFLVTIVVTFL
jgi:Na+-translocating ferredoxin:NAD+ oxidoreductase RnfD subunit